MIKNLVFDLGGVLLDIEVKRTYDAFRKLDIEHANEAEKNPEILELFMNLEKGMYTRHGFHKRFRVMTGFNGCNKDIDRALNAMIIGYWPSRISRVQELGLKFDTYILSNTNEIHCAYYNSILSEKLGIKNLDHLVKKAYYSHDLKSRKPDREIYDRMIMDSGIRASESVFIDDRQENLDAAKKLGFEVILVDENHTIMEGLSEL